MYPASPRADYTRLTGTPFSSKRLRELTAIVAGAGALGNEVARILGLLGTGRVVVVDPDTVEASNLPRSTFFWARDQIGQNKALALVKGASSWFPDTGWFAEGTEIADVGFQKIAAAHLIFSCVDSDLARLEIAYISTKLGVPVMDGGTGRQNFSHGRVTYFPATRESACYSCLLSPRKRRELLSTWHATLQPCTPVTESGDTELVSTPTMAAVVGALQVEFGLRNLFHDGAETPLKTNTLEVRLAPDRWLSEFHTPVSAECPFHEPSSQTMHPLPRAECTFRELLDSAAAKHMILDWPICTEAKCQDCGRRWEPMLRLAALRRYGKCPSCGSKGILEIQTIRTVGRDSPWIDCPVSALQLPVDHLYTLQSRTRA